MYELQQNLSYKVVTNLKAFIIDKVSLLIQKSFSSLSPTDSENITLKYDKNYRNIFKNSNIETYYPQLLMKLTKSDITLNNTVGEIHFNNGYIDVKTMKFLKRDVSKHFITKFIRRDYVESTKKQRNSVLKHIKKVYPDEDDLECILLYLGSALSWKSTADQTALFLLGLGSSGKSFILSLTKKVMECYFLELQSDVFAGNNTKIDKILNTYKYDPQTLFSWVNEPVDKKMNSSLFKVWVDGKLQSTMLYQDGQFNFEHHSRCITTANTMPQIIVESGTTRRILSYTHRSQFTNDENIVDKDKNIYKSDNDIVERLSDMNLLDAWFDILLTYCHKWINGVKPKYTENFDETKGEIITNSDIFQDFIDSKLKITNLDTDKISKDDMRKAFLTMYPDKHLTTVQVMTSLKERKINYNCNMRCSYTKIRGCYYGVKFSNDDYDSDEEDPLENGVDKTDKSIHISIDEQIAHLKARILNLEKKKMNEKILIEQNKDIPPLRVFGNKTNTEPRTKPAKVVEVIETDNDSEDDEVIRKLVENSAIFWD